MSEKPTTEKPTQSAESPTTAQPLDFDDEDNDAHDSATTHTKSTTDTSKLQPKVEDEDAPPPKPPRPMSPQAQAEATLIEAFPDTDAKVVKAVLVASRYKVDQAFNALLSMSDPNFKEEEELPAPPQPPRPQRAPQPQGQRQLSQMEQDELYARQLAEHYNSTGMEQGGAPRGREGAPRGREGAQRRQPLHNDDDLYEDRDRSFFDDDLPAIGENIKKGFMQTQQNLNKWINDFRKRIDGDDEDEGGSPPRQGSQQRQNFGPSQSDQLRGIQKNAERTKRSGEYERYDADAGEIDDDFTRLELRDEEGAHQQPPRNRPLANPALFKSTSVAPPQSGPVDEVDALEAKHIRDRQPSPSAGGKTKKWQPLTSVAPDPEGDGHDPFSLGDSDDEAENKKQDLRPDDSERLKKVASESKDAATDDKEGGVGKKLQPAERSGSIGQKDKETEKLLKEAMTD